MRTSTTRPPGRIWAAHPWSTASPRSRGALAAGRTPSSRPTAATTTSCPAPARRSVTALPPASLSGLVFEDFNDDGQVDFGETGHRRRDDHPDRHRRPRQRRSTWRSTTDGDGAYVFLNLRPGRYTHRDPAGRLHAGHRQRRHRRGGLPLGDRPVLSSQPRRAGVNGLNYNFGEQPAATGRVQQGQTAGIGFWNNKNGQALIKALNGGAEHPARRLAGGHLPEHVRRDAGQQQPGRQEQRRRGRLLPAAGSS